MNVRYVLTTVTILVINRRVKDLDLNMYIKLFEWDIVRKIHCHGPIFDRFRDQELE
jgi:hypothetical protein